MGVLPLEFKSTVDRNTLQIDGSEVYDVLGDPSPGGELQLVITRQNGEVLKEQVICRLDTAEELSIYQAGGVLQRFAQDFLATNSEQ